MASLINAEGSEMLVVPSTPQAAENAIIASIRFEHATSDPLVHFVVVSDDKDFWPIASQIRVRRRSMTIAVYGREPLPGSQARPDAAVN